MSGAGQSNHIPEGIEQGGEGGADPALILRTQPEDGLRPTGFDQGESVIRYVCDLMAKNYEAVGFLPRPRLEEYVARGQVLLQTENDEPCGYLAFGNGWPSLKVYQCCIQYDARRLDHATDLVHRLTAVARARGCTSISLWCADDLDANSFWRAAGFKFAGQRNNGNRRGRLHNHWVSPISGSLQADLFMLEAA